MTNEHWFRRDHALVMQAAANLDTTPAYADQLWKSAEDPQHAALFLLALFARERGALLKVSDPEAEAYAAGYGDGLEDARAEVDPDDD